MSVASLFYPSQFFLPSHPGFTSASVYALKVQVRGFYRLYNFMADFYTASDFKDRVMIMWNMVVWWFLADLM